MELTWCNKIYWAKGLVPHDNIDSSLINHDLLWLCCICLLWVTCGLLNNTVYCMATFATKSKICDQLSISSLYQQWHQGLHFWWYCIWSLTLFARSNEDIYFYSNVAVSHHCFCIILCFEQCFQHLLKNYLTDFL